MLEAGDRTGRWNLLVTDDASEKHVYALLSGEFDITQQELGISPETLGWRSCLGLHMWYKFGGGAQSGTAVDQLRMIMTVTTWHGSLGRHPNPGYRMPALSTRSSA